MQFVNFHYKLNECPKNAKKFKINISPLKYIHNMKRIMYLECIVPDHPKNNALCIEILALLISYSPTYNFFVF